MRKILVLVEHSGGTIEDSAWELASAARGLAADDGGRVAAVVLGADVSGLTGELCNWFDDVFALESPRLAVPDGVAAAELLAGLIEREQPFAVLIPHTNNGMDLAPALTVKADAPLLADCISLEAAADTLSGVRTMYGGKVHARVSAGPTDSTILATVRPGSFQAGVAPQAGGTVHTEEAPEDLAPQRRFVETIAPEPGAVDITQAEVLVGVGRALDEEEQLEMIRSLADAIGAEIACTRPVVDKGWLPKTYQIGTSGVAVKPKVYVAIGISGSYQHIGGIKGSPYIAAINKDPAAPIFGVADVGIVGDMYDIVPLLEQKIREV